MRLDIRLDLSLTMPDQDPSRAAWQLRDPLDEVTAALARSLDSMSLYLPSGAKLAPPAGSTWAQTVEVAIRDAIRSNGPEVPPMGHAPRTMGVITEQAGFEVRLEHWGNRKISVIKAVRSITGMGLADTKNLVESAPVTITSGLDRKQAEAVKAILEEAGGKAGIR